MRRRILAFVLVLGLMAAACGSDNGAADPTSTVTGSTSAGTVSSSTSLASGAASDETTSSTAITPEPDPNRPVAPDFDLQLGTGELYQLSAETKPVYLVFWAEW